MRSFLTPARRWLGLSAIGVVLCLGAGLRLASPPSPSQTPDERVYLRQARSLLHRGPIGLKELVAEYQRDPEQRFLPPPTRAGYLWLLATSMRLTGREDARPGTSLAGAASIGSLLVVALIGLRFFPLWATVFGLVFFAVSPVELMLARRTWQDALFELLALSAVYVAAEIMRDPRAWRGYVALAMLSGLSVTVKESAPAIYALVTACALADLLIRHKDWRAGLKLVAAQFVGTLAGVTWLAHAVGGLATLYTIVSNVPSANAANWYAIQYQTGSGYRVFQAFWIVSPVSAVLAVIGLIFLLLPHGHRGLSGDKEGSADWHIVTWIAIFILAVLALPVILPHWINLRYVSVTVGPVCLLAGLGCWYWCARADWGRLGTPVRRTLAIAVVILAVWGAVADYRFFREALVRRNVEDLSIRMLLEAPARF